MIVGNENQGGNEGDKGKPAGAEDKGAGGELSYETWLTAQPENVKTMLEGHTQGLSSALKSEREARKELKGKLSDAANAADGELKQTVATLNTQAKEKDRQLRFFQDATKPEIGVRNPDLAYLYAKEKNLFLSDGSVDFKTLRAQCPEVFVSVSSGHVGAGATGAPGGGKPSVDDYIRQQSRG